MKRRVMTLVGLIMIVAFSMSAQKRGEGLKSAIVEYVMTSNGNDPINITQYSDNYNALISMEMTIDGMNIKTITRNDSIYVLNIPLKSGFRYLKPQSDINYNQLTPEIIKAYNIEAIGTEEVLGKMCTVYTARFENDGEVENAKTWVYKGVMLKTVSVYDQNKQIEINAISLKENPSIAKTMFSVPAGFNIADMK